LWGKDTLRQSLQVACGKWEGAMPDAWRGGAIWCAVQKQECGHARLLHPQGQG